MSAYFPTWSDRMGRLIKIKPPKLKHVGKVFGGAAKALGKAVAHTTSETLGGTAKAVGEVGKGVKNIMDATVGEAGKGVISAGRSIEDSLEGVADYAKEHPLETALILGAGFTSYVVLADLGAVTISIATPAGAVAVLAWEADAADRERDKAVRDGDKFVRDNTPETTVLAEKFPVDAAPELGRREVHEPFTEWPGHRLEFGIPVEGAELRDPTPDDPAGGLLLSPRDTNAGIARRHGGLDFLCKPGDLVYASMTGTVERPVKPYADSNDLGGILIRNEYGFEARILYVEIDAPLKAAMARGEEISVTAGRTLIGRAQDVEGFYKRRGKSIPNHVHADWTDPKGRRVHPDGSLAVDKK